MKADNLVVIDYCDENGSCSGIYIRKKKNGL